MKSQSIICILLIAGLLLPSCATLYHDVLKAPRGKLVEIRTEPPGADIYLSTEYSQEGKRVDSMVCSSTPCKLYIEPDHWITLKKQGYKTEQVSPDVSRSFAYWLNSLLGGGLSYLFIQVLGMPIALGAIIAIAIGVAGVLIDVKNPMSKVVSGIPTPVTLQLVDAELAKQGEAERVIRDQREEKQRKALQGNKADTDVHKKR
jgi:hypothetical protein